ncbi:hypothetical protein [Bacillus sp. LLTC93]|uniref:hypothetical protein n=1 Tax=Bacillus sp. LLTC93 TaxID=2108274 RepID=UPI000D01D920|nr:hypothetical protein [Bacillus sp. LLTC93]PRO41482.1 hypothetical protein C6W18_05570 [Bacillus sp. LLTC93]
MTKYKTEKRKAEVGERILITNKHVREGRYKNGDVLKVDSSSVIGVLSEEDYGIYHFEYEVIVGEQAPAPNLDEMDYGEIIALVEDAMKALRTRQLQGRFDAQMEAVDKLTTNKSDQQRRDVIVARAKVDIEALYATDLGYRHDFIVNAEKRTVVALRKSFAEGYIRDRGIAKCAPTDCFNAHIGKAIALRRALGLEVPAEYLNVPQPTAIRVGDVVEHHKESGKFFVCDDAKFPPIGKRFVSLNTLRVLGDVYKIVDDSRTEGGA